MVNIYCVFDEFSILIIFAFTLDLAEKKENMAESVSRAQAKLERKRQRKMEKKLAKAQEAEKSLNAQKTAVADTIPSEEKSKVI